MNESMAMFSEATREWFEQVFGTPTDIQQRAWPQIAAGNNALIIAPTGSGKTLSAFLWAIDSLMQQKLKASEESQPARSRSRTKRNTSVRVLYISPLKALGVDVAKNLQTPLRGIEERYQSQSVAFPSISVAIRSGDTSAKERQAITRNPPDILVTTPESLYLMLTSKAREVLRGVHTVILDEVHALAGTKRGAHLALSLERLDQLLEHPAQRIGLSATVNPVEQVAHFLGGAQPVSIVQTETKPNLDLRIVDPAPVLPDYNQSRKTVSSTQEISGVTAQMRALAQAKQRVDSPREPQTITVQDPGTEQNTASVWPALRRSVLDQILAHRTTLIFVNSRGLAERLTAQINDLYAAQQGQHLTTTALTRETQEPPHYRSSFGSTSMMVNTVDDADAIAMAHHGSVSKERRKYIEEQLKSGKLRCVIATSSLELGIDMGSIDLVIQIAPPLSIASGLQRVGRADHRVGGVSHALIYPLTREQIMSAAASVEGMLEGNIEPIHVPQNPLDVLAQQTVAAASIEAWNVDSWYQLVCRAYPYATLERALFDSVIGMLTGAYNTEAFSAFRPPLMFEQETGMLSARPGAQRIAVTSGGTIPDRGLYSVVLPEAEAGKGPRRVGELDEEMVYESRVGDVITLGTSTWQIQEITHDRVVVVPAPGRSARLPFWHGDEPGRVYQFGQALGEWTAAIVRGLGDDGTLDTPTLERLQHDGADNQAIENLAKVLQDQRSATGIVPDSRHLVIERCRDEEGDWRVIIHSPYGRRVHEPWALAINARLAQQYGFEGHVYAADDGIVLRLPEDNHHIDIASIMQFDPDDITRIIESQIEGSVLFAARFRECAARALFMPRTDPGKRVPLWQQRLRASQLLAAARTQKNFPLVLETARECLQDVYDVPHLKELLSRIMQGAITVHECETSTPSPFADRLLFGFVGSVMYDSDTPQAERQARLLSMDPQVLERLLGGDELATVLDHQVIDTIGEQLASKQFWNELDADDIDGRVHRYAMTHTPFTADMMITELKIPAQDAVHSLERLQAQGEVIEGYFDNRLPQGVSQWVAQSVLRRIRSQSLQRARKAIRPVSQDQFQRVVLRIQGVGSSGGKGYEGTDGVLRVIEQCEGIALPIHVWETQVFPVRVHSFTPMMLDELIASGEVVWIGAESNDENERIGNIRFYTADSIQYQAWAQSLATQYAHDTDAEQESSMSAAEAIYQVLADGGAYSAQQLSEKAQHIWQEHPDTMIDSATGEVVDAHWTQVLFEEGLWALAQQGRITNSTFAVVRSASHRSTQPTRARMRSTRRRARIAPVHSSTSIGLWRAILPAEQTLSIEEIMIDHVEILLDRYGVIAKALVEQSGMEGGFSSLYPILRRMEEQGQLVRGIFVEGFGAAQFARRETVDALRADTDMTSCIGLAAQDPANLYGAALSWPQNDNEAAIKATRRNGAMVVLRGGIALIYASKNGKIMTFTDADTVLRQACLALADACRRGETGTITLKECNGIPLTRVQHITQFLRAAGFTPCPQGLKLYR